MGKRAISSRSAVLIAAGWLASAGCTPSTDSDSLSSAPPVALKPRPTPAKDSPAQTGKPKRSTAVPPQAVPLPVEVAQPYYTSGVAGEAAQRFRIEDWTGARAGFDRYLRDPKGPKTDADRARVRLLMAVCDDELDEPRAAVEGFQLAAEQLPLLSDFAHFRAARALYLTGDMVAAERHVRQVASDAKESAEAQLLLGDILRATASPSEVAAHYRHYLSGRKRGPRLAEATYWLAEALEAQGQLAGAAESYRRITVFAPLSAWSDRAKIRLEAIAPKLPPTERAADPSLSGAELLERGLVYYHSMRNRESAADLAAAQTAGGLNAEQRCVAAYHEADSWWKERKREKSAPLFDRAHELCKSTRNVELQVKAAYQAGRSYARLDQPSEAIARYQLVETYDHSYADDARLRQAEEYRELDDQEKVGELLASIPTKYPDGDMRAEATWRLAWRAYKERKYDEAVRWLNKQIEIMPVDNHWYGAGQAQYWLGRAYGKQGKRKQSIEAYRSCVRLYPMGYYALLSLNRLRESHRAAFDALVAEIQTPPADYDPKTPDFSFRPRAVYATEGFLRGIEFLRLGLGRDAAAELARAGFKVPAGRSEVTDPDQADLVWAVAYLYDQAGRYDLSHWPTRWHVLDYQRQWPVGHNRARWQIAYPMAYASLIERAAAEHGYPMALQMAIMREESAFDPLLESYANAIGLTQMIFPTARRFGKGTGIAITRENLRDPEKNVIIGSRFLAFLYRSFEGRIGLMVPSYNAGEGATWRWMRERHSPAWDRDEFEEEIPGDQARNYTKRVVGSFFAYSYLKDGTIPEMRQEVPLRLVPKRKR